MSFTAVILKLPFSALSTVRWGEGRRNAPRKGEWTLSTPVFCPLRSYARRSRRLRAGSRWATGTFPLKTIHSQERGIPHLRVRKCWSAAALRRSTSRGMDWKPRQGATGASGEAGAAVVALRTSPGEVPQLFPANCFTYVLEKDMALSFRNHSSAQWVQQGANTCETPTEAAPSPFLKHFFVCLHSGKPTAGLFDPIFSLHHTHIKHYNSV